MFFVHESDTLYLEDFLNRQIKVGRSYRKGAIMGFADTFKALSDPVRREILEMLKKRCMSAGEIASHFDMTGATISYHLSILKKAELVKETKQKNFIYYELNTSVVEEVMLWLSELRERDYDAENK